MSVIAERLTNIFYDRLGNYKSAAMESREKLLKVAEIAFYLKTGLLSQRKAVLSNGQEIQVVLPETVSNSIYVNRDFEPVVSGALDSLLEPGMCYWNVGAHIGLRLKQAHQKLGPHGFIYAFEPTTRTREFLEKHNARDLSCLVAVQPIALSNFDGYTQLTDFGWRYSGSNTIEAKPRMSDKTRKSLTPVNYDVPVTTVDALVYNGFRPPDVLSIDAEGSDYSVLMGALSVLRNYHPAVIFEGGDEGVTDTKGCIKLLQSEKYRIFDVNSNDGLLIPHKDQQFYRGNCNLVAVWG